MTEESLHKMYPLLKTVYHAKHEKATHVHLVFADLPILFTKCSSCMRFHLSRYRNRLLQESKCFWKPFVAVITVTNMVFATVRIN